MKILAAAIVLGFCAYASAGEWEFGYPAKNVSSSVTKNVVLGEELVKKSRSLELKKVSLGMIKTSELSHITHSVNALIQPSSSSMSKGELNHGRGSHLSQLASGLRCSGTMIDLAKVSIRYRQRARSCSGAVRRLGLVGQMIRNRQLRTAARLRVVVRLRGR